jgi:hypothetical protein
MDNPPAFPRPHSGTSQFAQVGMTLRDYFAAKAMQSLIPSEIIPIGHVFSMAVEAYAIADEMMKARTK